MCLVRDTMIKILGDPRGVSLSARLHISKLLTACGHDDLISKMKIVGDRWILQGYAQIPIMPLTENNAISIAARCSEDQDQFKVEISPEDCSVKIGVPGCGLAESVTGNDQVIALEQYEGNTTLYVWDDINDPDHIEINMEAAFETNRRVSNE